MSLRTLQVYWKYFAGNNENISIAPDGTATVTLVLRIVLGVGLTWYIWFI